MNTTYRPIEMKSVKGVQIASVSTYNEHTHDLWNALEVQVYETNNRYYFKVGGFDFEKSSTPFCPTWAYSAKKSIDYKEAAKFLLDNPNWCDWD